MYGGGAGAGRAWPMDSLQRLVDARSEGLNFTAFYAGEAFE
jgi:hypothetical protein